MFIRQISGHFSRRSDLTQTLINYLEVWSLGLLKDPPVARADIKRLSRKVSLEYWLNTNLHVSYRP